ncbi:MAG: class I SAM-dependent methyltransferase [Planctomycetota bacterium]|jgi:SAM-dependent methyltransferase
MSSNWPAKLYKQLRELYYRHLITFWNKNYSYFKDCTKILDVGCGLGKFLAFFPEKSIGLDISEDSIRECKAQGFQVIKAEAKNIPFEDETFDGIRCSHIIEHFPPHEAYQVLKETARVLKPGGIIIIQSPLLSPQFYDDITHVRPYPPNAILSVFRRPQVIQQSFEETPYRFKLLKLEWRYASLFYPVSIEPAYNPSKLKIFLFFKILSLILYKLKIHSWKKNGYTLVLRKLAVPNNREDG